MDSKKLYIQGMHCAACESLIERKLKKSLNLSEVKASLTSNSVTFQSDNNIDIEKLNSEFKDAGYSFSLQKPNSNLILPLIMAISAFIIGFFLIPQLPFANTTNITPNSPIQNFFILGIVAGFSTCAALTGGLLLTVSQTWPNKSSKTPYLIFNGSRLIAFIILGSALGLVGSTIAFNSTVFTMITIVITVIMLVLGLQMLQLPFASKIIPAIPKNWTHKLSNISEKSSQITPAIVGALTFIVPCGFTILAQSAAMGTASPTQGALVMGAFALGTLPALVLISSSNAFASNNIKIAPIFNRVVGSLLVAFAASTLYNQSAVILPPSQSASVQSAQSSLSQNSSDAQIIQMEANSFGYMPKKFTVKANHLVKWEIYNNGASGCTNAVQAPGLVDGYLQLKEGLNTFEFTPTKTGTFKFTCWMGMVPPGTITVN